MGDMYPTQEPNSQTWVIKLEKEIKVLHKQLRDQNRVLARLDEEGGDALKWLIKN